MLVHLGLTSEYILIFQELKCHESNYPSLNSFLRKKINPRHPKMFSFVADGRIMFPAHPLDSGLFIGMHILPVYSRG